MRASTVTITAAVLALATTGCDGRAPSAESVRLHLERSVPGAEFRRESHVRLGRFTLGLAKGAMRLVAYEDRETRRALSQIRSIDVASYEVVSWPATDKITKPIIGGDTWPTFIGNLTDNR